jgi:hypothetical protein
MGSAIYFGSIRFDVAVAKVVAEQDNEIRFVDVGGISRVGVGKGRLQRDQRKENGLEK